MYSFEDDRDVQLTVRMPHVGCEAHGGRHVRVVTREGQLGFEQAAVTMENGREDDRLGSELKAVVA